MTEAGEPRNAEHEGARFRLSSGQTAACVIGLFLLACAVDLYPMLIRARKQETFITISKSGIGKDIAQVEAELNAKGFPLHSADPNDGPVKKFAFLTRKSLIVRAAIWCRDHSGMSYTPMVDDPLNKLRSRIGFVYYDMNQKVTTIAAPVLLMR